MPAEPIEPITFADLRQQNSRVQILAQRWEGITEILFPAGDTSKSDEKLYSFRLESLRVGLSRLEAATEEIAMAAQMYGLGTPYTESTFKARRQPKHEGAIKRPAKKAKRK